MSGKILFKKKRLLTDTRDLHTINLVTRNLSIFFLKNSKKSHFLISVRFRITQTQIPNKMNWNKPRTTYFKLGVRQTLLNQKFAIKYE